MHAGLRHFAQASETCRHRDGVAGEGACLVNRAGRRQGIHHLTTTAECANRHTAADDFAKAGQIRHNAVVILRAGQRHAEAGHDFIDNQQRAELVAQRAQARQKLWQRRDAVHITGHRLNDDAGDILRILFERGANRGQIVIGAGQGVFGEVRWHARRVRLAERQRA